jgi:hypothetical protein
MRRLFSLFTIAITTAALTATLALSAAPAGARVVAPKDKFCAVFREQFPAIDFEGLGSDEAKFAANLFSKAEKTGVRANLKKDLKQIAKVYDRIARGEPAIKVLDAKQQKAILPALRHFSTYFAKNCFGTAPTT